MMKSLLLIWCTISLILPTIRAYVYLIKPPNTGGNSFCYTNEADSGIAFVRKLNKDLSDKPRKTKFESVLGKVIGLISHDCQPGNCKHWEIQDGLFENHNGDLPPVLDRRWNDLPEKVINEPGKDLMSFKNNASGVLFLSILAKDSVKLLFTKDSTQNTGFEIAIDGWGDDHSSKIRKLIGKNKKYDYEETTNNPILKQGTEWILMELQYNVETERISLKGVIAPGLSLKIEDKNVDSAWLWDDDAPWKLVGSVYNGSGILKLHSYGAMQAKNKSVEMSTKIAIPKKMPICFSVTFFADDTQGHIQFHVRNSANVNVIAPTNFTALNSPKNAWASQRFTTASLEKGSYTLTVKVAYLVLGEIRFCTQGPYLVHMDSSDAVKCQSLNASNHMTRPFSANDNGLEPHEAEKLCEKLRQENCKGVKYCSSLSKCTCLSGHRGQNCDLSCAQELKYGINCNYRAGKCVGDKFNIHSGECSKGCVAGFKNQFCKYDCTTENRFGVDCANEFKGHCASGGYNVSNGHCILGCQDGYIPPLCDNDCTKEGRYGKKCKKEFKGQCKVHFEYNFITGHCKAGCAEGYVPPLCNITCESAKKYGSPVCNRDLLGKCKNGIYDIRTGVCTEGCHPNYFPPQCTTTCKDASKYGTPCTHNFTGRCKNGHYNISNGHCTQGCRFNDLFPPFCTQTCLSAKKYGSPICKRNFTGRCINETYDFQNGECTEGCIFGYAPPFCTKTCSEEKKFGEPCSQNFMGNCETDAYNISSGHCTVGCKSGFFPPFCTETCVNVKKFGKPCTQDFTGICKIPNKYDYGSGHCTEGCDTGYRSPFCAERLLKFSIPPTLTDIGAYSASVDLSAAMEGLLKARTSEMQHFAYATVMLEIMTEETWVTIANFSASGPFEFTLNKLKQSFHYIVSALITESNNVVGDSPLTVVFKTLPCTSIDGTNTIIKVVNQSLVIQRLDDDPNLCHFVKVEVNNQSIDLEFESEKGVLQNLTISLNASSTYKIVVYGDDGKRLFYETAPIRTGYAPAIMVGAGIIVILAISVCFIITVRKWKGKNNTSKAEELANEGEEPTNYFIADNAIEMDFLPPSSQTPVQLSTCRILDKNRSRVVPIAELEKYVDDALKTDLLKKQHKFFPRGQTQPWVAGNHPVNKKKNRNDSLAAYDSTRVVLQTLPDDDHSDYINANFIDGYRPKAYIATQGPKQMTVGDFWRMIWQEKVTLIVMVANAVENGKAKCDKYWPDLMQEKQTLNFSIQNESEKVFADYVIRTLSVSNDQDMRQISHFHFTTWPDHGVPLIPQSMAAFANKILQIQVNSPITVHCSVGVGRTGTFILIDACLRMAKEKGFVDMLAVLTQMRTQRANMVDNEEQYEFAHLVLLEALALPVFEFPCSDFTGEFQITNAKTDETISRQFLKVNEVCAREKYIDSSETVTEKEKCRYPEMAQASASHIVRLLPYGPNNAKTFVNAVYVDGFRHRKQFIATQVPMVNTVEHFWTMVQQHNAEQVIILNDAGPDEGEYLPKENEPLIFSNLQVVKEKQFKLNNSDVGTYFIKVTGGKNYAVNVVSLSGWGVGQSSPPKIESLVEIWEKTERSRAEGVSVVVCHDGVTASGLFLGIGIVLEKIKLEQQVDAALATRTLRQARPNFISSKDQYEALFMAALCYLQSFDT